MRILAVILAHNRFDLVRDVLDQLRAATKKASIVLFDNGSAHALVLESWVAPSFVMRFEENFGNYPVFPRALEMAKWKSECADILAVFHSDLFIWEAGWDQRVIKAFEADPKLGLVGFIGSSEIGEDGGRGLGTVSNFQGRRGGGDWRIHGAYTDQLVPAAVVDGCSMIFRTDALTQIGSREGFPPHHFYDRLISCQMLEAGWRVGIMGIACDHLGGQTSVLEPGWHKLAEEWCKSHGIADIAGYSGNWDLAVYREAERQFLDEYRNRKGLIPCSVSGSWVLRTAWRPQVTA